MLIGVSAALTFRSSWETVSGIFCWKCWLVIESLEFSSFVVKKMFFPIAGRFGCIQCWYNHLGLIFYCGLGWRNWVEWSDNCGRDWVRIRVRSCYFWIFFSVIIVPNKVSTLFTVISHCFTVVNCQSQFKYTHVFSQNPNTRNFRSQINQKWCVLHIWDRRATPTLNLALLFVVIAVYFN